MQGMIKRPSVNILIARFREKLEGILVRGLLVAACFMIALDYMIGVARKEVTGYPHCLARISPEGETPVVWGCPRCGREGLVKRGRDLLNCRAWESAEET